MREINERVAAFCISKPPCTNKKASVPSRIPIPPGENIAKLPTVIDIGNSKP